MPLFLLICLIGVVAGDPKAFGQYWGGSSSGSGCCGGCDGGNGGGYWGRSRNSVENSASAIARTLIDADHKMQQFCNSHSDRALREVYGVQHFQIKVKLAEFTEDDIQVRVRQRLVSVHARTCSSEYAALRILPDVATAVGAVWKFDCGELTVLFPYRIPADTEVESRCGCKVGDGVVIVPKCAAGITFDADYDVSFGDSNLKAAIRRYLKELANEGSAPIY